MVTVLVMISSHYLGMEFLNKLQTVPGITLRMNSLLARIAIRASKLFMRSVIPGTVCNLFKNSMPR